MQPTYPIPSFKTQVRAAAAIAALEVVLLKIKKFLITYPLRATNMAYVERNDIAVMLVCAMF